MKRGGILDDSDPIASAALRGIHDEMITTGEMERGSVHAYDNITVELYMCKDASSGGHVIRQSN